jgi:hypothetical protein
MRVRFPIVRFATKPSLTLPVTVASWWIALSSLKTMSVDNEVWARFRVLPVYALEAYTFLHAAAGSAICEVLTIGPLATALATDRYTSKWMCGQRPE